MLLQELKANEVAIVDRIEACAEVCQRFQSMGFCCGAVVRMIVPGSPCAVALDGCRIMLRLDQARVVRVTPLESEFAPCPH